MHMGFLVLGGVFLFGGGGLGLGFRAQFPPAILALEMAARQFKSSTP